MADPAPERRALVEAAITTELARQGAASVDAAKLVEAVLAALSGDLDAATPPVDDGKRPDELNATNDD